MSVYYYYYYYYYDDDDDDDNDESFQVFDVAHASLGVIPTLRIHIVRMSCPVT